MCGIVDSQKEIKCYLSGFAKDESECLLQRGQ